ncbi:uncharacterized protein LOC128393111 [Panonychus citri]|uniref:uncharacterized protein LOC128393111 n=1 Tax=Panonychus citri TaxID=50023 RepID=UPI0023074393|nr:uncharacterized protein LOC128393111 [Panonychus citri]
MFLNLNLITINLFLFLIDSSQGVTTINHESDQLLLLETYEDDEQLIAPNERTIKDRNLMTTYELLFSDADQASDSYLLAKDHLNKLEDQFQTFLLFLKHNVINKDSDRNSLIMDILRNRIYIRYTLEHFNRKLFISIMNAIVVDLPETIRSKFKSLDWSDIWDQWTKYDRRKYVSKVNYSDSDGKKTSIDSFDSRIVKKNPKDPLGIL